MKTDPIAELRAKAEQYAKSPYSETFVGHNDARFFAQALLLALDELTRHAKSTRCGANMVAEFDEALAALVKGES